MCDEGYTIQGVAMRTCVQKGENGEWSGEAPTCISK